MVQTRRRLRFVAEALQVARVHGGRERQHLERDAAVERDLLGFVHDAHAAAADFADEPEVAEGLAGTVIRETVASRNHDGCTA